MTPFATNAADGRIGAYSRDYCIDALREYAERYGPSFPSAAFNPGTAKWADRADLIERYYAGRSDGSPWPSLNALRRHGTFSELRIAAGLPVNRPGPAARRPVGVAQPIRDVRERRVEMPSEKYRQLTDALAHAEARLDRALARAERAERLLADRRTVKTKIKTVTRTDLRAATRLADARAASMAMRDQLKAAIRDRDQLQAMVDAMGDVDMAAIDAATSQLRAELTAAIESATTAVAERDAALSKAKAARAAMDAHTKAMLVAESRIERLEAELAREQARDHVAERRADKAEERVRRIERQMAQQAAAIVGEERKLTPAEIDSLRQSGPAGPVVMAAALKTLAKARASNGNLDAALLGVAKAAMGWRDRLR